MEDQQMHFKFIDVLLLYYGQQHVSATRGDLQSDCYENKNTIIIKTCLNHYTGLKNHTISG
jgi:hypothetical protein